MEVERSLRVLDGAIALFCSVGGVEPQSETVWRQADKYGIPRIALHQQDGPHRRRLLPRASDDGRPPRRATRWPLQIPIGREADFRGVVDLVEHAGHRLPGRAGHGFEIDRHPRRAARAGRRVPPKPDRGRRRPRRHADGDYLEGREVDRRRTCASAIRAATLDISITPVLCGSRFKNKGVQPLLDAVVDYLPSPLDVPRRDRRHARAATRSSREADDDEPFSALAFKVACPTPTSASSPTSASTRAAQRRLLRATTRRKDKQRAHQPHPADARQPPRRPRRDLRRRPRRGRRPQVHQHRRHAVRRRTARSSSSPWSSPSPSSPSPSSPRPRPTRTSSPPRSQRLAEEDPTFRVRHRRGDRPDHHRGHGRAAPRDHRRPPAARVQRRRQRGPAAGRLPRDHPQARRQGRGPLRPPERRPRPVRPRASSSSSPTSPAAATSSRTASWAAPSRASTSRRSTRASRRP